MEPPVLHTERPASARAERAGAQRFFADIHLVRRVEAGWDSLGVENALAQRRRNPDSRAEVLAVGGGHAVFLGAGSPLSQAQGLGLNGPVGEAELDLMECFFKVRETPTQIEVASLADPALLPALGRRGYEIVEQTHNLVCTRWDDIRARPGIASGGEAADIEVRQVDVSALEEWVDLLLASFFEPPQVAPPALREGAISMALAEGVTTWLARIGGQPAGGGSLAIQGGLAMICGDGTLPRFRGRGVQNALLRARLEHAWAAGCDLAAICTAPGSGSQRNAERQGFRVVCARTMMLRP